MIYLNQATVPPLTSKIIYLFVPTFGLHRSVRSLRKIAVGFLLRLLEDSNFDVDFEIVRHWAT